MKLQTLFEEQKLITLGQFLSKKIKPFDSIEKKRVYQKTKIWDRNVSNGSGMFGADQNICSFDGGPIEIKGDCTFQLGYNQISSFDGAPRKIRGSLMLHRNKFSSISGIQKHIDELEGELYLVDNDIRGGLLGLLLVKKLKRVTLGGRLQEVEKIINKYLPEGDMIDCQNELYDAGFGEYAKL